MCLAIVGVHRERCQSTIGTADAGKGLIHEHSHVSLTSACHELPVSGDQTGWLPVSCVYVYMLVCLYICVLPIILFVMIGIALLSQADKENRKQG